MTAKRQPRILLAKPGLDGHDRGVKVVAMALRDAGYEVIYLGLRQSADSIMYAAEQEDVDAIGISVLSGVHVEISSRLLALRRKLQLEEVPIFVGGTIPDRDAKILKDLGIADVFPVGVDIDDVVLRVGHIISSAKSET